MKSLDRFDALTDRDTRFVYDRKGKRAGAVIHVADGQFAAWGLKGKLGEFADADEAARAVLKQESK
jgi:hypothetical protein